MAEITIGDRPIVAGDRVVYPNGGICRFKGVESKDIGGQSLLMLMLEREEDGATVMVPKDNIESIGLRKVAGSDAIDALFEMLASSSADPELDWKVRHKENFERMAAGGLLDTATVLKGLHALARLRPLPQRERELYDNARHQLVGEISVSLGIPPAVAENNIDYALDPPPGSGRQAPADVPIDLKSLRKSAPRPKRSADVSEELEDEAEGAEDDEELLGAVADEEGAELESEEEDLELGEDADEEDLEAEALEEDEEPVSAAARSASAGKKTAAKGKSASAGPKARSAKSAGSKSGKSTAAKSGTKAAKGSSTKSAASKSNSKANASKKPAASTKSATSTKSAASAKPTSRKTPAKAEANGSGDSKTKKTGKTASKTTSRATASASSRSKKAAEALDASELKENS